MSPQKSKKLLLQEVKDTYVRENFRRIEFLLEDLSTVGVQGPIGPQGPPGTPGDPGYDQNTGTVAGSGGTLSGGDVDTADNRAVKYIIVLYNEAQNVTFYREFVLLNSDGTTNGLKHISGFMGGDEIDHEVTPDLTAGIMNLDITNNEAYSLQVEITQILLANL